MAHLRAKSSLLLLPLLFAVVCTSCLADNANVEAALREWLGRRMGGRQLAAVAPIDDTDCLPKVDIKGDDVGNYIRVKTLELCRAACDRNSSCEYSVFYLRAGICHLKRNMFTGRNGVTEVNDKLDHLCMKRNQSDTSRKFEDCVSGIDLSSNVIRSFRRNTTESCREECDKDKRCVFSVRYKNNNCELRNALFNGNGTTGFNSSIDKTCWTRRNIPGLESLPIDCLPNVDIRGTNVMVNKTNTLSDCRKRCDSNRRCQYVVRWKNGNCFQKTAGFVGTDGFNMVDNNIDHACLKRKSADSYIYGDVDCMLGVDIQGTNLGVIFKPETQEECRAACDAVSSCLYAVRYKSGECQLRSSPYNGTDGTTGFSSNVDRICWRRK